jgi:uncharacterized protein with PIN domain
LTTDKGIDMNTPTAPAHNTDIFLTLYGDTVDLLRRTPDDAQTIIYPLSRRASIKDILEGLGIPHTEIGRIVLSGQEQTFEKIAEVGEHFHIHPLSPATPPTVATILRPETLRDCIFLVDINVARLAGLLRMAGFDAEAVGREMTNNATLDRAIDEERILLTRNRDLLKQRRLVFGHLVRSQEPEQQLREVINLYSLQDRIRPFSRCIACNQLLAEVDKKTIIDQLLPLTKKYYHRFHQCTGCGKIYWQGSHHDKMTAQMERILDKPR